MRRYLRLTPGVEVLLAAMRRIGLRHKERAVRTRETAAARRAVVWALSAVALLAALFTLAPSLLEASDHADPTDLRDPESNITGLFFFPQGDQMIVVFNIRRALTNPKPYNLEPFEYTVNMDLTTPVSFDDAAELARFGGTVIVPEKIHPDVSIKIHLNDDVTLKDIAFTGLTGTDSIRQFVGVRDDPFVFPRFFKKNVISMVMSIPNTSFPVGKRDFILWGTVFKDGKQVDHVGRSIRTQLPRLGFLNPLPPKDHPAAIMKEKKFWDDIANFLKNKKEFWSKAGADLLQFTFQLRKYDVVPDVMIYSDRFPPTFPNGRQLADDVVAKVCATDDCLLQEISFIEGGWPRATVNDKPFLAEWPYVAEPWPDAAEPAASTQSIWPYVIAGVLVLAIVFWILVEIVRRLIMWLWRLWRRRAVATA
jgi:hypothetical protein